MRIKLFISAAVIALAAGLGAASAADPVATPDRTAPVVVNASERFVALEGLQAVALSADEMATVIGANAPNAAGNHPGNHPGPGKIGLGNCS